MRRRVGQGSTHWAGVVGRGASGARRGSGTPAYPDQDTFLLIHRQALAVNELLLQVLQYRVIQPKLALESTIRQAPAALQQSNRLVQEFLKGHPYPPFFTPSGQRVPGD